MIAIDELLTMGRRGLHSRPGSLLLGSTGARLWADFLDDQPGFVGALDFIHKLNMPLLFTTRHSVQALPAPSEVEWRPSHLTTHSAFGELRLSERRYVTWGDVAVSLQHWHNAGSEAATLKLETDTTWLLPRGGGVAGEREIAAHGFTLRVQIASSNADAWAGVTLHPGESLDLVVAAAVGVAESDSWDELSSRVASIVARPATELLEAQVAQYQSWFDRVPGFSSSSPVLDRLYAYRWFILRHNLAKPGLAPLDGMFFYEGRSHKMSKTPWEPVGWEFSKLIPLSTPMHLIDARWHHDTGLGTGVYPLLQLAQAEDGQFNARTLQRTIHPYANFTGWASYQYALAQGLHEALRDALPMLKRQVLGEEQVLASGGDGLPIQKRHQLTGKEYQPSYWYFHGYPDDPMDQTTYTPLKRVDRAIYQYLNARGVAGLCRLAGDPEAEAFDALADKIAASIIGKQWDAETCFFYDLHFETDEKAMVRNIVGLYPYWAGLTGAEHLPGFLTALGPEHFDTPNPFPSVSPECPVFRPGGSWKGHFLKGRNGCMWDGPTWPYTNSITLDAIARVSRDNGHAQDALFAKFFWKYTLLHFQQRDGINAYLVEHYDSMTGEPISDEPDYNHSYMIDLIVRLVAGVCIAEDGILALDPIDIGLQHFALTDLSIMGHRVDIVSSAPGQVRAVVDGVETTTPHRLATSTTL